MSGQASVSGPAPPRHPAPEAPHNKLPVGVSNAAASIVTPSSAAQRRSNRSETSRITAITGTLYP